MGCLHKEFHDHNQSRSLESYNALHKAEFLHIKSLKYSNNSKEKGMTTVHKQYNFLSFSSF